MLRITPLTVPTKWSLSPKSVVRVTIGRSANGSSCPRMQNVCPTAKVTRCRGASQGGSFWFTHCKEQPIDGGRSVDDQWPLFRQQVGTEAGANGRTGWLQRRWSEPDRRSRTARLRPWPWIRSILFSPFPGLLQESPKESFHTGRPGDLPEDRFAWGPLAYLLRCP